jgi:hypothetical protein
VSARGRRVSASILLEKASTSASKREGNASKQEVARVDGREREYFGGGESERENGHEEREQSASSSRGVQLETRILLVIAELQNNM